MPSAGGGGRPTERDALDQATPSSLQERGPRRPRGAGERPPRSLLLQHTRGRHGQPKPAATRAGRPATGGRNRAAALQLPATAPVLGTWRPCSRARTARGRATAQHDVKGIGRYSSQRAQEREYREQQGHHPAPSASALRRGGARQPDIGSRSLAVQPGSWVGSLGIGRQRPGANLHGSAPPVHPRGTWGDSFPNGPNGVNVNINTYQGPPRHPASRPLRENGTVVVTCRNCPPCRNSGATRTRRHRRA